jgi:chromate transporter
LATVNSNTALGKAPATPAAVAPPSLAALFTAFLTLGLTAFGGPAMVAYIRELAVDKKRWVDEESFESGVALCQAIPGATAMQSAGYVGLRVRGVAGAAATFIGFGVPAFVLMMSLSALYGRTHELPVMLSAFSGLRAIIVALVANATVTFGRTSLKRTSHVFIAAMAAVLFFAEVSPFLVIVLAGLLALALFRVSPGQPGAEFACRPIAPTTKAVAVLLAAATLAFLGLWIFERRLFNVAALMFRIDLFAFGGGFSSIPLLFHEVVDVRHWIDSSTLLNGIVLGQITPGPIVITATFVGYLFAGVAGGVAGTVGIFLPSFLMLVAVAPHFDRLRSSPRFNHVIGGILCSFVGLLLTVTVRFTHSVRWDWTHVLLAVAAFITLRYRVNVLWTVLVGTGLSIVLCR